MKKVILPLLGLLLALSIGYYLYRSGSGRGAPHYYADYLPQDTIATLRVDNINTVTDSFAASPLAHLFAPETMHAILHDLQAGEEAITEYDRLHDTVAGIFTDPSFRTFLGDDLVLALLPLDRNMLFSDPAEALRHSLVLFATSAASSSLDSLARMVMSRNVTAETVEGRELTRVELDTGEVIHGYGDGRVVLLGLDPQAVITCLRIREAKDPGQRLLASPLFESSKRFWDQSPAATIFMRQYINCKAIQPYFAERDDEPFRRVAQYLQGLTSGSTMVYTADGRLHMVARTEWNWSELDPGVRGFYDPEGRENTTLHLLGPQTLFYSWAPSMNLLQISQDPQVTAQEEYRKADAVLRENLGISMAELAAVFGPQYGMVLGDIVSGGLFPLPRMVFFCQVRDREKAGRVVERLRELIREQGAVKEQQVRVGDQTIYYWPFLPGEATQVALVLDGDMLLLANSRADLEAVLQQDRAKAARLEFDLDSAVREELLTVRHGIGIMRPARLADRLRDPLAWLAGIVSASKGIELERLNREILELFARLEIVSVSTRISETRFDSHTIVVPVAEK